VPQQTVSLQTLLKKLHFQMICLLFLCPDLDLHSVDKTACFNGFAQGNTVKDDRKHCYIQVRARPQWQVDQASGHEIYSRLPAELPSLGETVVPTAC
jgi:hypothetical protein